MMSYLVHCGHDRQHCDFPTTARESQERLSSSTPVTISLGNGGIDQLCHHLFSPERADPLESNHCPEQVLIFYLYSVIWIVTSRRRTTNNEGSGCTAFLSREVARALIGVLGNP